MKKAIAFVVETGSFEISLVWDKSVLEKKLSKTESSKVG